MGEKGIIRVVINPRIVEQVLRTNSKINGVLIKQGLPLDARLINSDFNKEGKFELYFESEIVPAREKKDLEIVIRQEVDLVGKKEG